MKLLFDVLHPAHVWFFHHLARTTLDEGGDVMFYARDKDVTLHLLRALDLPHEVLSGIGGGRVGLAREMAVRTARLTRRVRRFQPDLLMGIMGPVIAPVGRMTGVPSWVFYDTETATATNRFVFPMCDRLYVPDAWRGPLPAKAVRYPGYHELAYLHPDRFTADASVRAEAGLGADEPFALVRLVSWEASHDVGDTGFVDSVGFVQRLAERIRVVVSGERGVPDPVRHLAVTLPPERIHHLLSEATMYVGEGATMAAEAAVLGTPAVFVHTARLGYMLELEERYGLLWNTPSQDFAESKAFELAADPAATVAEWSAKRARMLEDRLDVGEWVVELVRDAVG